MTIKAQRYSRDIPLPLTTIEFHPEEECVIETSGTYIAVFERKMKVVNPDVLDYSVRNRDLPGITLETTRLVQEQINEADIRTSHRIAPYRIRWEPTLPAQSRK